MDGTLYPCHRFVGMKKWIIGTIWDGPDVERCKSFFRVQNFFGVHIVVWNVKNLVGECDMSERRMLARSHNMILFIQET